MVRIAVAEGCPLVRHALKEVFNTLPDFTLAWETGDAARIDRLLHSHPVEMLLLDPSVPEPEALFSLLPLWQRVFPTTRVLIYTSPVNELLSLNALRAGVAGVLNKNSPVEELIIALQRIASGKTYISAAQAEDMPLGFFAADRARTETLPPQEEAVLVGIVAGKRLKEIAADMSLSPKTAHTYKSRLMKRFGLKSIPDVIRFAERRQGQWLRDR